MFVLRWRRYPRRGAGGRGWSYRAVALLGAGIVAVASPAAAPKTGTQHPAQGAASGPEVYAWGNNADGQIGTGAAGGTYPTPQQVTTGLPAGITAVAAGYYHSLAVGSDGHVYAWGNNADGRLGIGTAGGTYPAPQQVTGLAGITAVAAGERHSLALTSDGHVYAWGYNGSGRLGTGTAGNTYSIPQRVTTGLPAVTTAVSAGWSHSLAVGSDGHVYAWGSNGYGQLGNGTTSGSASTPQQVTGLPVGITAVAASDSHSLALTSDGRVYAWGDNEYGQLGTGTGTVGGTYPTPQQVTGLPVGITAITAGAYHSLALTSDGRVYAWGANGNGQVGTGASSVTEPAPRQVTTNLPAGITAVAAGGYHSLALSPDGRVYAWGYNGYGQVGTTTGGSVLTPRQVTGLPAGITAIAGGEEHSLAAVTAAIPPVAGVLSVTVPDTATVGSTQMGATVSGQLGTVTVTDDRAAGAGSWTVQVSATDFTSVPPAATDTIPASAGTYASGTVTFTPGITVTTEDITLSGTAQTVVKATRSGANTAEWDPTLSVEVPPEAEPGTYTGTISTSVSG